MNKLQGEIEDLEKKSNKWGRKLMDKKEEYTRLVSLPALKKSVGTCYKYLNSYGGDRDKWFLYLKVVSIDEKTMTFKCVEFQRTSMEIVEVKLDSKFNWNGENYFSRPSGYIKITNAEYNRAKKSLLKFIQHKLEL